MSDKQINVIDHLAERFGTQLRLAAAAGCAQSTMSEKRQSGSLTHDQMRRLLKTAPEYGVTITPADFFPELGA
jgi:transcriptional regulator with XRE-family HTH domain